MNHVDHIAGQTFHGRKGVIENAFKYGVDYVLLDPLKQDRAPALFSRNNRNLTSLHDIDHGGTPKAGTGVKWVHDVLDAHGLDGLVDQVLLLAQPRVFGHVFNPVSFWLCYDSQGGLRVVIPEVSNTFGDRHSYLCVHDNHRVITKSETLCARKIFYVSPFQPIEGDYTFRFDITDQHIGIWIDYQTSKGGLMATLTGKRAALTNRSILKSCLRRPFGSRRVLSLIHWQAFKLWLKGAKYREHTPPPPEEVSQ
jgi:DUF1365 family protein